LVTDEVHAVEAGVNADMLRPSDAT
jgi:hypothetical protein